MNSIIKLIKVRSLVMSISLFHLFTFSPLNISAGDLANYEVVPLPQSIVMQKGEPFVLNS